MSDRVKNEEWETYTTYDDLCDDTKDELKQVLVHTDDIMRAIASLVGLRNIQIHNSELAALSEASRAAGCLRDRALAKALSPLLLRRLKVEE